MDVFGLETSLCQSVGARAHSVVRLGTTRYQSISLRLQTHSISIANWPPKITLGGFRKDVFLSERVRVFDGQLFAYPSKNRVIFYIVSGIFQSRVWCDHIPRQSFSELVDDVLYEWRSIRHFPSVGFNVRGFQGHDVFRVHDLIRIFTQGPLNSTQEVIFDIEWNGCRG